MVNVIREEAEWTLNITDTDAKIAEMQNILRGLADTEAQRDLGKMLRNIAAIREDISREAVRCRGFNRTTGTMQKLEKTLTEAMAVTHQLLTMAVLLS